jgi:hypothetical protein
MASKRGPLSKAETFYITEHAKSGKDINEIATDLDRPAKSIQKCYTSAVKNNEKTSIVGDQFARQKGAVVMTENASTMSDATRKKRNLTRPQDCVTSVKK